MKFRAAGEGDGPALAELHARCFVQGWSAQDFTRLAGEKSAFCHLAEADGHPVGLIAARVAADEAEILTLAVDPSHRRRGIARDLVDSAVAAAEKSGAVKLFLEVGADNTAARALYGSAGFTELARRPAYYRIGRAVPEDAIVLVRPLTLRVDATAQDS